MILAMPKKKKKNMTLEDLAKIIQEEFMKFKVSCDRSIALSEKRPKDRI